MKTRSEVESIIDGVIEQVGKENLTVQYAMSIVADFKLELEDELSRRIDVDYDVIFIEEHYKVINILNDATLSAIGSQRLDLEITVLYALVFQMLMAACLNGNMKIIKPVEEDDNDDFDLG